VLLVESLLHRVQLTARGEALDRGDLGAVRLDGEHGARLHRRAVDEHAARAAARRVAADVRPGETERLAQEVGEQEPCLDLRGAGLAVDGDLDGVEARGRRRFELGHVRHSWPACAAEIAVRRPRSQ
jgi:hypothetical protein